MPTPTSPVCAHPSDVALIKDFLRPWVASGAVTSSGFVHAADLYSAEPQELARRFPAAVAPDGERAWYFLTRLRNKSPRGRRKARVAGQGWWHGEAGPKDVVDALDCNRILGQRQSFSFMRKTGHGGMPVRTGWIMVEHHLRDQDQGLGVLVEGLVLCKVYRSPRHHDADAHEGAWCSAALSLLHAAAAAAAPSGIGCKRKAADQEHDSSNAATLSENPDGEVSRGAATAAPAPGLDKKAAADDEDSSARTPTPKKMKEVAAAAAAAGDDEDSSAPPPAPMMMMEEEATAYYEDSSSPPPAPKKMKSAAADDDESSDAAEADDDEISGAASADNGRESSDSPAAAVAAVLHCPQCGFHLGALQAVVTPAQSIRILDGHGGGNRSGGVRAGAPAGRCRERSPLRPSLHLMSKIRTCQGDPEEDEHTQAGREQIHQPL